MKRALAERAKQEKQEAENLLHQSGGSTGNVVGTPSTFNSLHASSPLQGGRLQSQEKQSIDLSVSQPPPRKIPRIKSSSSPRTPQQPSNGSMNKKLKITNGQIGGTSSTSTSTSVKKKTTNTNTNKSSSSNPKKRGRPPSTLKSSMSLPTIDDEENDEDNERTNTKFFLKHQNRALASEMFKYKHAIRLLEKERDIRREECKLINGTMRNIVSNWNGMESIMMGALEQYDQSKESQPKREPIASLGPASSTGNGDDVETVYSIMQSIIQLSKSAKQFQIDAESNSLKKEDTADTPMKQEDGELVYGDDVNYDFESDSAIEQQFLKHLSAATTSFSSRLSNFQRLVTNLVQQSNDINNTERPQLSKDALRELLKFSELKKMVASLQNTCQDLESKLIDLKNDRDIAKSSEMKVRRGLYRVASGRMKINEVLKDLEESSSLGIKDLEALQQDLLSSTKPKVEPNDGDSATGVPGSSTNSKNNELSSAIVIDGKTLDADDVIGMKKKIDDLTLINNTRDEKIKKLMCEKENRDKEITSLLAKASKVVLKDEVIKASPIFIELSTKLDAVERQTQNLKNDLQSTIDRWAITKGDLNQSRKTIEDHEDKHKKRLKELSENREDHPDHPGKRKDVVNLGLKLCEVDHKLKHAVGSVRQSENFKAGLLDAIASKNQLERRIHDLKQTNERLEAERDESNQELLYTDDDNLTKDNIRKLKRELGNALSEREQMKMRLERAERDHQSITSMNARLQEQMVDKEDMNANSLSTILHLRQLSEQLEGGKSILEKKLKSAEQLAVMSRLAANAREKVEKESMREKEVAEEELRSLKTKYEEVVKQNDDLQVDLNKTSAHVEKARNDLVALQNRCDNLTSSSTENEKQVNQLSEDLVVAKKDAVEAMQKVAIATASTGGNGTFNSEFTAEQLTIQVNQLKSRIACPVCNTRDKKVIINRCRHMFCRHCVALSLESRNRKCPSCGLRFDKKDVEDVWF